jgi:ATPase subunit of ABC transporter with duplicated ATPase domains
MQNHLSGADLNYHHTDGSNLFSSLTFSFSLMRTGLVGPNGIGKTTLLDLMAGVLPPSGGSLTRSGRVSYLTQDIVFNEQTTIAEAIHLSEQIAAHKRVERGEGAMEDFDLIGDEWDLMERIEQVFAKLGIAYLDTARRLVSLSGGELTRVRIAGLLLKEPDFLLLDEPTNHLDLVAREFIYDLVKTWRRGLVVVSHDRKLLMLVDQIAEMTDLGIKIYGGNFEFYLQQRQVEKEAAEQTLLSAEQRLKDAKATAQRARERQEKRQSAGKKNVFKKGLPPIVANGLRRQAENTAARLKGRHEQKVEAAQSAVVEARQNISADRQITVDLEPSRVPPQKRIIELTDVNYRYADVQNDLWPEPLNISIIGPERIWLKGANGSGKSTLIDLICGRKTPTEGEIKTGAERVALLDQQVSVLDDSLTVLDNIKRVAPLRPEHELRILLGRFLFYHDDVFKTVSQLSGGERMRAGLACLLGSDQSPEVLIADEPTNNLDLSSVEELVSAIRNFRGALIVVTHDLAFIEEIGIDRVIELTRSHLPVEIARAKSI